MGPCECDIFCPGRIKLYFGVIFEFELISICSSFLLDLVRLVPKSQTRTWSLLRQGLTAGSHTVNKLVIFKFLLPECGYNCPLDLGSII